MSEPSLRAALWRGFVELIAPPLCAQCRRPCDRATGASRDVAALCRGCHAELEWLARDRSCRLCQREITDPEIGPTAQRCGACSLAHSHLDACLAAVSFAGRAERWIHRFKYPASGLAGLDPAPLAVLHECARDVAARACGPLPDLVVPIPLHPRRLRARGFNPAALLAAQISTTARIPLDCDWLRRTRDTPSQTGLDRPGRRRNMTGAFACRPRAADPPARIWLVDDVVTTGATLGEAARVLRLAGVREIVALCAARTPHHRVEKQREARRGSGQAEP